MTARQQEAVGNLLRMKALVEQFVAKHDEDRWGAGALYQGLVLRWSTSTTRAQRMMQGKSLAILVHKLCCVAADALLRSSAGIQHVHFRAVECRARSKTTHYSPTPSLLCEVLAGWPSLALPPFLFAGSRSSFMLPAAAITPGCGPCWSRASWWTQLTMVRGIQQRVRGGHMCGVGARGVVVCG